MPIITSAGCPNLGHNPSAFQYFGDFDGLETSMFQMPSALDWLKGSSEGQVWLRDLPVRVKACIDKMEAEPRDAISAVVCLDRLSRHLRLTVNALDCGPSDKPWPQGFRWQQDFKGTRGNSKMVMAGVNGNTKGRQWTARDSEAAKVTSWGWQGSVPCP